MRLFALALVLPILALTAPAARAEVHQKGEGGFVIRTGADVEALPNAVWRTLVNPSGWWSPDHTYSSDAANLSLDPRVEGCFCELLPNGDSPNAAPRGHVEHMRVIFLDRGRMLRLSGALGPLQSEAVTGTLTVNLKARDGGGTRILWEYVVGGYMRYKTDEIAPAVDKVISEQMARLAARLGPVSAPEAPAAPAIAPDPARPAAPAELPPVKPPAAPRGPVIIGR